MCKVESDRTIPAQSVVPTSPAHDQSQTRGVEVRNHRRTQIRTVGVTAPAAAAGVKRSRETAFIEADALQLSETFAARLCLASPRANWR